MRAPREIIDPLKSNTFDVVIIGGGISGSWLALHCSHLGYKTALIEQADFASQTSSSSSKLLHSGIRYLQQMQFGRVRESALERAHYLYAAPHLSVSVPFAVPTYRDFARSKLFLNCGMLAYQLLCVGENSIIQSKEQELAPIKSISSQALNKICPMGDINNTGAVVFHERHMHDSERMVLSILQTAQQQGADVFNYISADKLIQDDERVTGLIATDQTTQEQFEIKSRLVVNAAGPWIDELNSTIQRRQSKKNTITGFAVGSHIVCRQIADHAIAITTEHQSDAKIDRGGRHVFIIPWRGLSLIGTSYDEVDKPELNGKIQASHVDQLLSAVNHALPEVKLSKDDLISGYSGLYPLKVDSIQSKIYQGSGEYQIIDHAKTDLVDGYITALGAKYTTGRKLSVLTQKVIAKKLGRRPTAVSKIKLHNSNYTSLSDFKLSKLAQYTGKLDSALVSHLIDNYGSEVDDFIAHLNDDLMQPICGQQPDILGQVSWAVKKEQAIFLSDVLFGRTSVGLLGINNDEIRLVATLMSTLLDWDSMFLEQQIESAINEQQQMQKVFA